MVKVLNIIKVLIGFHAFSRCDQTGKFHGYRKKSFQQTPLRSPDVLDTFGRLGNDEPPIKTNLTKFEKLVLKKKTSWFCVHSLLLPWRKRFPEHIISPYSRNLPTLIGHHCQIQMIMVGCLTEKIKCSNL